MPNVGRTAPNKEHTQSVVFTKKAGWTVATAKKWCKDNNYFTDGLDENATQLRFRQYDPNSAKFIYRSKVIKANSITLVLGIPKGKAKGVVMAAIPVHHTPVDSKAAWDGPKAMAKAEGKVMLRHMCAWVDSKADPDLKGSYKLPHHLPGVGTPAILAGVNNSMARLPQTKGIPKADFPGIESHLKAHQADAKKQSLIGRLTALFAWFAENVFNSTEQEIAEQAVSMPSIYNLVQYALDIMSDSDREISGGVYRRLIDCYLDGAEMYAIIGANGKLYKALLTIVPGGVTLGDLQEVEIDYKPIPASQQGFKVLQQADGKYRWFAFPAATAVLNKNGYLNSRKLYDSFIANLETNGYPFLTFYHIGERLELGSCDFVTRDGYTLLMSGTFNDNPLAQELAKKAEIFDGVSIGYDPLKIEQLAVGDGVEIPVHTQGILVEASAIMADDAACILTGFTVSTEGVKQLMDKKTKDMLLKLAGNNPAAKKVVDDLVKTVDDVNQTIEDENLVRQAGQTSGHVNDPTGAAPAVTPAQTAAPAPVVLPIPDPALDVHDDDEELDGEDAEPQEITLTEEAMATLVQGVSDKLTDRFATLETSLVSLKTEVSQTLTTVQAQVADLTGRLKTLELTDEQKLALTLQDMPRNVTVLGYRPSKSGKKPDEPEEPLTSVEVAAGTLAKIKPRVTQ